MKNVNLWMWVCLLAVGAVLVPEMVYAVGEEGAKPDFTKIIDFTGVFTDLMALAKTVIVAAIGFALSIWGVKFFFRMVKSFGRA